MPIATPEQYAEMLDTAKAKGFAFPAFNVSSSQTLNAVLQGLTEAGSDGIIQVTTGGADYFAGHTVKARATGALAFARFAHEVAKIYPITVALHTDHCPKNALDDFVFPLIDASEDEVKAGRNPIFQSHMWDGSAVPLDENLEIAKQILPRMKAINAILEVEIGVVGGEEDGVSHDINEHLYTTLDDAIATVEALGLGEQGRYMAALTFGNVHGVYAPGNVKLKPELLKEIQDGLAGQVRHGREAARPRLPRRLGLDRRGDRHGGRERRREDEHRHRHAVRVHALDRRLHVLQLRGRAQGRRQRRQQEAVRPPRMGQGRRVGHGRARRRVHPAARLRRRSRSAPRSRMSQQDAARTPDESADRPTPGGAAASPAPRDERPRPQYGEYAPEGWTWQPPRGETTSDPAPQMATPPPPRAARAPSAASVDRSMRPERPADRAVTILLLVIGVLGVWLSIGVLQALPESMQLLHTQEGIEPYTPGPEIPGLILTGSIVQIVIWVAAARRVDRAHARAPALLLGAARGRRRRVDRPGRLHRHRAQRRPRAHRAAHDDRRLTGPRHRRRALRIARRRTAAGRASPPDVSRAG